MRHHAPNPVTRGRFHKSNEHGRPSINLLISRPNLFFFRHDVCAARHSALAAYHGNFLLRFIARRYQQAAVSQFANCKDSNARYAKTFPDTRID
jgi:hypothetical protein